MNKSCMQKVRLKTNCEYIMPNRAYNVKLLEYSVQKKFPNLDTKASQHNTIHLLNCQWCSFWYIIFNERKALMFPENSVVWKTNRLDWTERQESLLHHVFLDTEVYRTNIYPEITHDTQNTMFKWLVRWLQFNALNTIQVTSISHYNLLYNPCLTTLSPEQCG